MLGESPPHPPPRTSGRRGHGAKGVTAPETRPRDPLGPRWGRTPRACRLCSVHITVLPQVSRFREHAMNNSQMRWAFNSSACLWRSRDRFLHSRGGDRLGHGESWQQSCWCPVPAAPGIGGPVPPALPPPLRQRPGPRHSPTGQQFARFGKRGAWCEVVRILVPLTGGGGCDAPSCPPPGLSPGGASGPCPSPEPERRPLWGGGGMPPGCRETAVTMATLLPGRERSLGTPPAGEGSRRRPRPLGPLSPDRAGAAGGQGQGLGQGPGVSASPLSHTALCPSL